MKFTFTFVIFFMLCLGLSAQEANITDEATDSKVTLIQQQNGGAGEAHYVTPVVFKKQKSDYPNSVSALGKEYRETETIECLNDDQCNGDTNSCSSKSFLWGALSIVAGLMALTSIKGK